MVHATTYLNASPAELDRYRHLPPELAADITGRADVRQLVLTRLAPPATPPPPQPPPAAVSEPAPITVATPGTTITATSRS